MKVSTAKFSAKKGAVLSSKRRHGHGHSHGHSYGHGYGYGRSYGRGYGYGRRGW